MDGPNELDKLPSDKEIGSIGRKSLVTLNLLVDHPSDDVAPATKSMSSSQFIGSASAADLQYMDFGLIPIGFDRFSIRMV